jgi:hypothetical protein
MPKKSKKKLVKQKPQKSQPVELIITISKEALLSNFTAEEVAKMFLNLANFPDRDFSIVPIAQKVVYDKAVQGMEKSLGKQTADNILSLRTLVVIRAANQEISERMAYALFGIKCTEQFERLVAITQKYIREAEIAKQNPTFAEQEKV